MSELTALPNIGKKLEQQLNSVGIETIEQLKELGSKEAWLRIKAIDSSACLLRLRALEGAVRGIDRFQLPDEVKADLREFYYSSKNND